MLKMLSKKIDRAKKKKIIFPVIVDEPMHIPSHHILNRKIKLLTKQALAREEMISSVLLREVQVSEFIFKTFLLTKRAVFYFG